MLYEVITLEGKTIAPVAPADVGRKLDAIATRNLDLLDAELGKLMSGLDSRLAGARRSFLERATASLIRHLENYGEDEIWQYDPAGLRLLMRSAYRVFSAKAVKACEKSFAATADEIRALYIGAFQLSDASASYNFV